MDDLFAIVPPVSGDDSFVALTRTKHGKVFEKQILNYGDLKYKGQTVHIDDEWADKFISNFDAKICDTVQVPKADNENDHSEDPDRNIGEVIGLVKRNKKIYAQIDVRDPDAVDKIEKKLYLGASAFLSTNYENTDTGERVGPTLLHVAVTNRPYVTKLEDFKELVALSADTSSDAVVLTAEPDPEEIETMTLDELIATLLDEHGIDVVALQEQAADSEAAVALSNKIQAELVTTGLLKLSNGKEATADELIGAVAEAGEQLVTLSNKIDELEKSDARRDAEVDVDKRVSGGFILPKDRDAMLELRLSNKDIYEKLIPEKPVVKIEEEAGSSKEPEPSSYKDEIDRLAQTPAVAAYIRAPKGN